MLQDGQIPTRENCDLTDPEERFLWCFTSIPAMKGAALMLPNDFMRELSAHLSKCGVMLECDECGHVKTPEHKWRRGLQDEPGPLLGQVGEWVPATEHDDAADVVAEKLDEMRPHVHRKIAESLAAKYPDDDSLQDLARRLGDK